MAGDGFCFTSFPSTCSRTSLPGPVCFCPLAPDWRTAMACPFGPPLHRFRPASSLPPSCRFPHFCFQLSILCFRLFFSIHRTIGWGRWQPTRQCAAAQKLLHCRHRVKHRPAAAFGGRVGLEPRNPRRIEPVPQRLTAGRQIAAILSRIISGISGDRINGELRR